MYSWGEGSCGALGFNDLNNQKSPRLLEIFDHNGQLFQII